MSPQTDACSRSVRWGFAATFLLAVASYLNALPGHFVFDDITLIVNNEAIKDATHVREILFTNLWAQLGRESNYYRPLASLLFLTVHSVFGLRPEAFHAVNIALHAGTAGLVFLLASRVLTLGPWPALIAGALFAVHPLHAEAVAWISGVMDLACTFFSVLAVWGYAKSDAGASGKRVYAMSLAALFLAVLSKEPAAVVPLVFVAYDLLFRRQQLVDVGAIVRRWAPPAAVLAAYLVLRTVALGGLAPFRADSSSSWTTILVSAPTLVGLYLEKLVVPVGLNVVHDLRMLTSVSSPATITTLVVLIVGVTIGIWAGRRDRRALFAIVLFVLPLLPALDVPALSQDLSKAFAERYAYFPSVGFVLLFSMGIAALAERGAPLSRFAAVIAVAVAVVFFGMTVARNVVWRDSYSLWSDSVKKSPNLALAHENLGLALIRRGQAKEGKRELQAALRLDPTLPQRSVASGVRAARSGQFLEAILAFQTALAYEPDLVEAHYDLAVAFESRRWIAPAVQEYRTVLALKGDHTDAHNNLGVLLAQAGQLDEAILHFEAAARARPQDAEVRVNLERAYQLKKLGVPSGHGQQPAH